jgi:hypothetical protein
LSFHTGFAGSIPVARSSEQRFRVCTLIVEIKRAIKCGGELCGRGLPTLQWPRLNW